MKINLLDQCLLQLISWRIWKLCSFVIINCLEPFLELGNLVNLIALILDMNYSTGSLPQNICQGGLLRKFTVDHNQFSGQIPKSLRNFSALLRLQLKGNKLSWNLSEDFGAYPRLNFIVLSHNNFFGEISSNGASYPKLNILLIVYNITGTILSIIGNSTQLGVLDLSWNSWLGKFLGNLGSWHPFSSCYWMAINFPASFHKN